MQATADQCAREVVDTVPLVMRFIRSQMRRRRIPGLSVTQFRVLLFISRCSGASLSAAADHVGLSLPAVSRMADNLVARGLLARQPRLDDRRGVSLTVTPRGERALRAVLKATQADLAEKLGMLNGEQRAMVVRSMQALRPVFTASLPPKPRSVR
jgi:DNA-binding MarR family transcriptional regulator